MIYILLILALFFLVFLSVRIPDKFFWTVVLLVSDPGGYLTYYSPEFLPPYLNFRDFLVPLLFLPILSPRVKRNIFWADHDAAKLYKFLIIFLIYQILIFGWLAPQNFDMNEFFYFLFLWRHVLFSVFLFIPAYIFSVRSIDYFFELVVITSFPILVLFLITFITGIELMPLWKDYRYSFGGYQRVSMHEVGYMQLLIYVSAILYVLRLRFKYRYIIFFSGSLMVFTTLITLTRGTIGLIFGGGIILTYVMVRYLGKYSAKIFVKMSFFVVGIGIIIALSAGESVLAIEFTFSETYKSLTGAQDIALVQARTENEIPRQIAAFNQNQLFGTGFQKKYFTGGLQGESLDVNDTPYIGMWAIYGVFGTLLYIILIYRTVWKYIFGIFQKLKTGSKLPTEMIPKFLLFLAISIFFVTGILFPLGLFLELIDWDSRIFTILNYAIIFAIGSKIKSQISEAQ